MRTLLLLPLALLLACGPKRPPPTLDLLADHDSTLVEVDVKVDQYRIEGSSSSDLRAEMNRRGPQDSDGEVYDGYARWHIAWFYGYDRSGEGCAPSRPRVEVALSYTMPRAEDETGWSASLSDKWSSFVTALWEHELGHGELAIDAGEQIQLAMTELGEAPDCDTLRDEVSAIGHGLLKELAETQRAYDRDTDHGREQGARWP